MKILIASDIHGSAHFCKMLISAIEKEKPQKVLLLGDILYHGPRNDLPLGYAPKEVIAILNPLKDMLLCVRGNCDAEVDQMVLSFPIMADYAVLPLGEKTLYCSHGHIYNKQSLLPMNKGDILINGHTHVPECTDLGDVTYLNCGSVSIPKENSPHSYMIFENDEFLWKNLENGEVYKSYKL